MLKQSTNNTQDEIKKMSLEKSNVEDAMNTLQK